MEIRNDPMPDELYVVRVKHTIDMYFKIMKKPRTTQCRLPKTNANQLFNDKMYTVFPMWKIKPSPNDAAIWKTKPLSRRKSW